MVTVVSKTVVVEVSVDVTVSVVVEVEVTPTMIVDVTVPDSVVGGSVVVDVDEGDSVVVDDVVEVVSVEPVEEVEMDATPVKVVWHPKINQVRYYVYETL